MVRDEQNESRAESAARDVAAGLDESTEKFAGGANVDQGATPGYTEENVEERTHEVADELGVKIVKNADGSHTAIDESQSD